MGIPQSRLLVNVLGHLSVWWQYKAGTPRRDSVYFESDTLSDLECHIGGISKDCCTR